MPMPADDDVLMLRRRCWWCRLFHCYDADWWWWLIIISIFEIWWNDVADEDITPMMWWAEATPLMMGRFSRLFSMIIDAPPRRWCRYFEIFRNTPRMCRGFDGHFLDYFDFFFASEADWLIDAFGPYAKYEMMWCSQPMISMKYRWGCDFRHFIISISLMIIDDISFQLMPLWLMLYFRPMKYYDVISAADDVWCRRRLMMMMWVEALRRPPPWGDDGADADFDDNISYYFVFSHYFHLRWLSKMRWADELSLFSFSRYFRRDYVAMWRHYFFEDAKYFDVTWVISSTFSPM